MHIKVEPLTSGGFAPYGLVLGEPQGMQPTIRDAVSDVWLGFTDLLGIGSLPGRHVTFLKIHTRPFSYDRLEKHDTSAEAFIPLEGRSVLMVVPPGIPGDSDKPDLTRVRAFLMDGCAGVLLRKGTWHAVPYNLTDMATFLILVDNSIIACQDLHVTPIEPVEFDMNGWGGK